MVLECILPFGRFDVGDTVDVPDGDKFSPLYFRVKEEEKKPKSATSSGKTSASKAKEE